MPLRIMEQQDGLPYRYLDHMGQERAEPDDRGSAESDALPPERSQKGPGVTHALGDDSAPSAKPLPLKPQEKPA